MDIDRKTTKAVKKYVHELPPALKERYGGSGYSGYTAGQVNATISALGLSEEHSLLAIAMFGDDGSFATLVDADATMDRLIKALDRVSQSGFADASAADPAAWLTRVIADSVTGDDVGEIGSEGSAE